MRTLWLCNVALSLTVLSLPASAADLSKVDRRIAKEPIYKTKTPKYCLLVFGAEAQTRVWLVLDGDRLYVDRNGDGDLTEEREAVTGKDGKFEALTITAKDGVVPGSRVELLLAGELTFVYCHTKTDSWQRAVVDKAGNLQFAGSRQAAPIIHFNGPLTLAPRFEQRFDREAARSRDWTTIRSRRICTRSPKSFFPRVEERRRSSESFSANGAEETASTAPCGSQPRLSQERRK
jgi:hypothetical protein